MRKGGENKRKFNMKQIKIKIVGIGEGYCQYRYRGCCYGCITQFRVKRNGGK